MPPAPKPKPPLPITEEQFKRYGPEAERLARNKYPNATATLPAAVENEIRTLIAEDEVTANGAA